MSQTRIPCLQMRGGTSKGLYFLAADLPRDPKQRDAVLLAAMGSPDDRQIDGLGGATSLTSKVAIIDRPTRDDADLDYLFAQVIVDQPRVDYGQNCGNILAGVGPFAIERGLVSPREGTTPVRIHMVNTGQLAVIHVPTPHAKLDYAGDATISGVPGSAAPLIIEFQDTAGSSCGALLPTGQARDVIDGIEVTCIDNGMPVVVLRAGDLDITGTESCAELDASQALKSRLERIRLEAGTRMNLGDVSQRTVPKMSLIAEPQAGGALTTRTFIPHRCHEAIGVLGAVSVATACVLPGSVAADTARIPAGDGKRLSIEHPTGEFTVELTLDAAGHVARAGLLRTARLLFDGQLCIPRAVWDGAPSPHDTECSHGHERH
ncbi:4-oxalomesaconate tautomerase [Halomonas sp. McH1-25]|uniref:4-oxalomesaconate tautomerase n=1 Tax=unclassified Halomonas TaxID=2609666 RepID=UPI001EF6052B|nr:MULTISPECIES: 4-oxalomesaconate tautomerase [unclassified Halomonas]MCG7601286.1 4-oxalomesaconate tautomerase [Halomonas sp. McH1-25]MCP1343263.1 4-oxalomesaconate tautomerase [Halomonas sp. FL8]MCP1360746.1 4-oxalomesaconate tautomerase [Halomonas sp. BBD45]